MTDAREPLKHWDILNALITSTGRKQRHYLEIGTESGRCLNAIDAAIRIGVDPHGWAATCPMSSDVFFEMVSPLGALKFDLVFIDGLHTAQQAWRDIVNSLSRLREGGYIVLHDCNPATWFEAQEKKHPDWPIWNGTTYQAAVHALNCGAFDGFTVDSNEGMTVLQPKKGVSVPPLPSKLPTFEEFERHWYDWLKIMPGAEFEKRYEVVRSVEAA